MILSFTFSSDQACTLKIEKIVNIKYYYYQILNNKCYINQFDYINSIKKIR